ncbi:MAG: putative Ig domain-containing protein, partial [Candidatus Zixiibacteriota bacterium]
TTFPAGMTIDANGLVSWTPNDVGDFGVTIEASNAFGTDVQSFTIAVAGIAPIITSTPNENGVRNELYTYDVDASGYPAPTFALATAPGGMTIDAVSGLISWTPADLGDFAVVVEASNVAGTDVQSFSINVVEGDIAPIITSTPVTSVTVNQLYSYDVQASGNPAPTFALTVAPAGMTINATTGLIQWTPTVVGDYDVTVVATNGVAPDAVQSFTITVLGIAPTFTSTPITTGTYGVAYSYDADADGIPAPTFALATAPAGMTIDAISGLVSWTPDDVGDFDVTIEASNVAGTAVQSFSIAVAGIAPSFTSTPVLTGTYGVAYSYDADAAGYPAPTFALTTAPAGMTIDAISGLVSWTPDDVGDFGVTIEASNVAGTAVQSFTIAVAGIAPSFTSTPITSGTYGVAYSYDADADGYPAPTFALTTAPAGMTIDANGLVSWTPDDVGDFGVTIEASNVAGTAVQSFTIAVAGIAPTFTSTPITNAGFEVLYTYDADADGYPAPTFALTTFPAGMTIDAISGLVSWTPDDVGDFAVVIEAANAFGTDVQSFTVTVGGIGPVFTSTPVLTGTYGVAYSYDANASGYPVPTFALATAPAGMTIDAISGLVSWIPGDVGDFDVIIEATNDFGTAVQSFTIAVGGIAPSFTSTPVLTGDYGVAYSYDADADGYPAPTFALTTAPAGMTIDGAGLVSWTPDDVGDFDVTIEASNVAGTAVQSFTIAVAGIAPSFTSTPITSGTYGVAYSYDADADGYPAPTFALTTAPAGMTIDANGLVSWTPDDVGDFGVTIEASNVAGTAVQSFTIAVAGIAPSFTSSPVLTGDYGVLYTYDADAAGYPAPTFALTTAPAGMTIDANGLVSWTPDDVGDFGVTIEASNAYGTAVQSFTIAVAGIAPSFTSTAPLGGVVGELYTYDANADGYPAPTFALTTSPLGMTIDAVSGLISWTPDAEGLYDVVIEASNAFGSDVQSFTINVVAGPEAPVITSTPSTSVVVNQLYSYDVEATGNPGPTFALSVAPAGMTINATTGLIEWTPGTVGDFDVTVVASNGVDPDAVQSFTITVLGIAPAFTSTPVLTGTYGIAYSYDADADGIPAPTFALTTAPAGMAIDAISGLVSWTPDDVGDFGVTIEASNAYGTDVQSFTIAVAGIAPSFTSSPVLTGDYGVAYSYDADADGYPVPTFALATAPAGMTIDAISGLVSWTPDDAGDFDVIIEATNSAGTATQSFTITVGGIAPSFTSTPITSGTYGVLYTYDADASGYPAPTFALSTAPAGMTIDAVSGLISWTPDDAGDFDVVIEAANSSGTAVQSFTITVVGIAPSFTSTPVTAGTYGVLYTYDADADGYPTPTFALATAPAGMTIDAIGLVSWTPDDVGDFAVTIEASNAYGTDVQSFTIAVAGIAPSFTSSPVLTGTFGVAYTYDADADGYPAPTLALTAAPAGMTIDAAGVVTWTPADVGDFDVTIEASNAYGTAVQSFTITVGGTVPVISSTPILTGVAGELYAYDVDADGYPEATFALTTSPAGMTIDAISGLISWTPAAAGSYDVVVVASNSAGSDAQSFTIVVEAAPEAPVITSTPVTSAVIFDSYAYDVEATGYPTPTFALTTAPLGMTIDAATGLISWTADALGDFAVTVVAGNGVEPDAVQSFTITVSGIAPTFTSTPVVEGTVDELYSYDADADGYPEPTFALAYGPAGMTIDAATGLIEWTPTETGSFDVTIEAINDYGTATQEFTITVFSQFQPVTFLDQDPIYLKDVQDKILGVMLAGFDVSTVDVSSILVNYEVPPKDTPYDTVYAEYPLPVLKIPVGVMRFMSNWRPIKTTVQDTYVVSFTLLDGTPVELVGDVNIEIVPGDLTLDGIVNNDDISFMVDLLWNHGKYPTYEELADIDGNGKVDPIDLRVLIKLVY